MLNLLNPNTDDRKLWDVWFSTFHLAVVSVADEIGLFSALAPEPKSVEELAQHLDISKKAALTLARVLTSLDFLKCDGDRIELTEISRTYLLPTAQYYWGGFFEATRSRPDHLRVLQAIKKDGFHIGHSGKTYSEMWTSGEVTLDAARAFSKQMHAIILGPSVAAVNSGLFKDTKNILDVGGGSGAFGIALTSRQPQTRATIFELPPVCEVAREYVRLSGVESDIQFFSGNFFKDPWPHGFDGVWFSNIFHDWSPEICERLSDHAFHSIVSGGKIFIHEMLIDEDKDQNLAPSIFDLLMFINHTAQQFTRSELFKILEKSGFRNPEVKKTFGYYSVVTATKP